MFDAVFFDLDGTLVDTAADFARAINGLLANEGRPDLPLAAIRAQVSNGARALTTLAFGVIPEDADFEARLAQLLDAYAVAISEQSKLFTGMDKVLALLEQQQQPWGVVTNKPMRFTLPLMTALGLDQKACAIVCPDHVAQRKPNPEGLLIAARNAGASPANCLYVGDHLRDIEAGRNAGMATACALYGYLGKTDQPETWQADYLLHTPTDLLPLLKTPSRNLS
jgi:phosphoglycolate phosphatase